MAGAQGSALAIAVCNAGGLGSLPCAMLSTERFGRSCRDHRGAPRSPTTSTSSSISNRRPDRRAKRRGARCWRRTTPSSASIQTAIQAGPGTRCRSATRRRTCSSEFKPPVVSFHFGLPSAALLARVKRWGAKILSSATTVDEARWLEARGVDAVIAQGLEAGGHRGMFLSEDLDTQVGTFALRAADRQRRPRAGDCGRRHRGCGRRGGGARARRGRRAGRHRVPAVSRGDDQRAASRSAEERRRRVTPR